MIRSSNSCSVCARIEEAPEAIFEPGDSVCAVCRLRASIVSNAVRTHESFDNSVEDLPAGSSVEDEFQREMEAHYLAFSATGTDVDTFDRLFSRFVLMESEIVVEPKPEARSPKRFLWIWGGGVLLASAFVVLSLMTQSDGPAQLMQTGQVGQLREKARQSLREKDFQTTLTLLNELVGDRAETARGFYHRGFAYFRLGNHARALDDFSTASTLDPSKERYRRAIAVARNSLRLSSDGERRLSTTGGVNSREAGVVQPSSFADGAGRQ